MHAFLITTFNKRSNMARTFKGIPSLHRLLESAPVETIKTLVLDVDEAQHAGCFAGVPWAEDDADDAQIDTTRHAALEVALGLKPETAIPLEQHALRILTLSEGRGSEAIGKVSGRIFDTEKLAAFNLQRDGYGRAGWLYLNEETLFDEAENLFYADHYRNLGKMYEAFEVDTNGGTDFEWNATTKAALEQKLQEELELAEPCKIDHIRVSNTRDDGTEYESHLLIVRHAGPLSSVAALKDGRKKPLYYRPAIEATLMFSPQDGVVEVFAESAGVRPVVASAFAVVGLKHDLSDKPLTLKQYNLARFLDSLKLDVPSIPGFDIEFVTIVEAEARPQNLRHRASLKVSPGDDIETVASELFGPDNIFRRAAVISKVVIAVRYSMDGEGKTKTLNITLSDPNRCNLRSNRDPRQRDFGFALLAHWGILQTVRQLDAAEENTIFPALLALYDQREDQISRKYLHTRGIPVDPLLDGGFLVRRGRHNSIDIDLDDGQVQMVPVSPSSTPGHVKYDCPQAGRPIEIPGLMLEYFEIKRDWIEERVVNGLRASLKPVGQPLHDDGLIYLGELNLDSEKVPGYLARQLHDGRVVSNYDTQLRARHDAGTGIVLCAGNTHPSFLGINVVVPLTSMLATGTAAVTIDITRLKSVYVQNKTLARGGLTVDFAVEGNRTATLFVPGKPALTVVGEKQIKIIQRLVDAYRSGNPAVATKDLMDGSGSHSPRQAFRNWNVIADTYIGTVGKRGAWMLLV